MRILTAIGELGITHGEREVVLRPSLYAMAKLGTPEQIVQTFGVLFGAKALNPYFPRESGRRLIAEVFNAAVDVLQACTDEDITELTGHMGSRYGTWVAGAIPMADMVPLARGLLKHGVIGVVPALDLPPVPGADKYSTEFDPRQLASQAMAHLGLSELDAWNMTATSFVLAMRAKYPPEKPKGPSKASFEKTMSWLDTVNGAR